MLRTLISTLVFLAGCASIDNDVNDVSKEAIADAEYQIALEGDAVQNDLNYFQRFSRYKRVVNSLSEPAAQICKALGDQKDCRIDANYLADDVFNAFATILNDRNEIFIFDGLLKLTHSDAEVALVIAHEYGHHIADHIRETQKLTLAEGLGILLVLSNIKDTPEEYDRKSAETALRLGAHLGSLIDRPPFDRRQELEADMIAMKLLETAEYNLDSASKVLLTIAILSGPHASYFDTHPHGPKRLATAVRFREQPGYMRIEQKTIDYCASIRCEIFALGSSKRNSSAAIGQLIRYNDLYHLKANKDLLKLKSSCSESEKVRVRTLNLGELKICPVGS